MQSKHARRRGVVAFRFILSLVCGEPVRSGPRIGPEERRLPWTRTISPATHLFVVHSGLQRTTSYWVVELRVAKAEQKETHREEADDALLAELASGSSRAFVEVYRRYARYVATIGFRLLGDDSEIDDLVQETFMQMAAGLEGLRDPKGFRSWLATIAVRCVWRKRAQRRRRALVSSTLSIIGLSRSNPGDRRPVDDLYEKLERLPERCRIPWLMHRVMGETLPDTATACQTSLTTTKRRIAEAETRLERVSDAE
jgi:RNA polymerase sigma-70 factor (ECF subfamily)